jgi:chemotaxis protein histidine kinase CheA
MFVFIDTAPTNPDQDDGANTVRRADHTDQGGASTVEAELRDRLHYVEDRLTFMEEQLGLERDANRENRRLLAAALERIPAIESPEATEAPENAGEGHSEGTTAEPPFTREGRLRAAQSPARGGRDSSGWSSHATEVEPEHIENRAEPL